MRTWDWVTGKLRVGGKGTPLSGEGYYRVKEFLALEFFFLFGLSLM